MKFLLDLTLGHYYPAASPVHGLDPRVKFFALFMSAITLLSMQSLWGLLFFFGASLGIARLARLPLKPATIDALESALKKAKMLK